MGKQSAAIRRIWSRRSRVSAGVRAAQVLSYPDTGLPYLVTIEPDDGTAITPAQLRSSFGDFTRESTHFGAPRELIFTGRADTHPWRVVLLVTVEPTRESSVVGSRRSRSGATLRRSGATRRARYTRVGLLMRQVAT